MELSDIETKVLIIIKDYLNKNRVFNAKKIIPFILNGLKVFNLENPLNESGIQKILWHFIRERIVVPGSKLHKDNLLQNSTRKTVYNQIDKNPGTHLRELMEQVEIGSHEIIWHTNLLIKFGLIRFTKIGKFKAFFKAKLPTTHDKEIFYFGEKNINQIIQLLYHNENGFTINQMADEIGIHFNTVNRNLHILNDLGLLYQKNINDQKVYLLNLDRFVELINGIEKIKKA